MAISIDSYIDVQYSGITVERIGLSAAMDTISNEDILDYIFCGSYNKIIHGVIPRKTDVPMTQYRQEIPFNFEMDDPRVEINIGGYDLNPNGMYMGVIWLYTDIFANHPENNGNLSHFKIVMDWDAPNYFATCPDPNGTRDNITSWGSSNTTKCFATTGTYTALTYVFQNHNINVPDIYPYMVFKTTEGGDDLLFISCLRQNANTFRCRPYTRGTQIRFIGTTTLKSFRNNEQTYSPVGAKMATYEKALPYKWNMGSAPGIASANPNAYGTTEMQNLFFYTEGGSNAASTIGSMDWTWYLDTKDESLLFWASGGLKFKAGTKTYKPIITGGIVVGFSDDMTTPSDLDNWKGTTKHGIPITPPSPSSGPFDVDPETYGWSGGEVSGMVKYYLLTSGQMGSLQSAIASNANWTIDYLNCIVSCFVVPNSGIFFDAPIPTTVKFKLDNATKWDTGVACSRIQGTINKSGGTIEIPRLTNTFYDFEPYSDYSIYIPFCGRIPIKGNVCLGREIKVTYYPDVPTCSLTAIVSCGDATIAIAKGSFGTMTPVTSNGADRKTAAVIGDVAPIITGIGTGIVGVALGNPLIVGAGAAQALGGIMGGVKETVQSYAYSVGSTGDSSFFGAGNRCFYYANYPIIDDVVNNSMFGHSVGYLCNTVGTLSSFTGFTICANPHVTFSATAEEREEIERLLSMGVIL